MGQIPEDQSNALAELLVDGLLAADPSTRNKQWVYMLTLLHEEISHAGSNQESYILFLRYIIGALLRLDRGENTLY